MKSTNPVKPLADIIGRQTFFFPDSLSNDRVTNDNLRCIMIRINGQSHYILTGRNVELTSQEFAIFKDAGIVTDENLYIKGGIFDPLTDRYED